jgi:hypothetical protein
MVGWLSAWRGGSQSEGCTQVHLPPGLATSGRFRACGLIFDVGMGGWRWGWLFWCGGVSVVPLRCSRHEVRGVGLKRCDLICQSV